MEENVFGSYEDIDAKLDEEFGGDVATNPEETTNEDVSVEEDVTNGEVDDTSNVETEESQEVEESPQKEDEGKPDSKKDYAFANLRSENTSLKKERDSYKEDSDYLKQLAASYGYDDVSKFQEAVRTSQYQREAQEKGYDPVLYKKYMEADRRIAQLEKEKEEERRDRQLDKFQNALSKAASDYGMSEEDIIAKLEEEGVTVDEILSSSNHKILINGVLVNEIKNNAKQSQIEDLQNLKGLVEDKNEQGAVDTTVTIDSLLKDDLAAYRKENFYD